MGAGSNAAAVVGRPLPREVFSGAAQSHLKVCGAKHLSEEPHARWHRCPRPGEGQPTPTPLALANVNICQQIVATTQLRRVEVPVGVDEDRVRRADREYLPPLIGELNLDPPYPVTLGR